VISGDDPANGNIAIKIDDSHRDHDHKRRQR